MVDAYFTRLKLKQLKARANIKHCRWQSNGRRAPALAAAVLAAGASHYALRAPQTAPRLRTESYAMNLRDKKLRALVNGRHCSYNKRHRRAKYWRHQFTRLLLREYGYIPILQGPGYANLAAVSRVTIEN